MNTHETTDEAHKSPYAVVAADGLSDFIAAAEEHLEDREALSRCEDDESTH